MAFGILPFITYRILAEGRGVTDSDALVRTSTVGAMFGLSPIGMLLTEKLIDDEVARESAATLVEARVASSTSNAQAPTSGRAVIDVRAVPATPPTQTASAAPAPTTPASTFAEVPHLHESRSAVVERLGAVGLTARSRDVSSVRPVGAVLDTDPKPGTIVSGGSTVNVLASAGVPVPAVEGHLALEACAALTAAGFPVIVHVRLDHEDEPGTVLDQEPSGRTAFGTSVKLTVAGPAMPSIGEGTTLEHAERKLKDAGMQEPDVFFADPKGDVVRSALPEPGTPRDEHPPQLLIGPKAAATATSKS